MRTKLISLTIAALACTMVVAPTFAQTKSQGENGLVGIKLYDSGMRLLQVFGDPDQILPLGSGGAGGAAGGGGGGGGGVSLNTPSFDFGDQLLLQNSALTDMQAGAGGGGGRRGGGGGGAAGGGGGGGGASPAQSYIRWVYNRDGCRYGFILDRNNRVVQIEATGLENRKVKTRKGISFGDTFKEVMESYREPEGYQITGDTILMRYMVRDKVAFRLNRLGPDKPHVVTAIVVAAGKV